MSQWLGNTLLRISVIINGIIILIVIFDISSVMCVDDFSFISGDDKWNIYKKFKRHYKSYFDRTSKEVYKSVIPLNAFNTKHLKDAKGDHVHSHKDKTENISYYDDCITTEKNKEEEYEQTTFNFLNYLNNYDLQTKSYKTKRYKNVHNSQYEISMNEPFVNSTRSLDDHEQQSVSGDTLSTQSKKVLYIGGLFDLTGSRSEGLGLSELTAARLAIDHVNKENIIPGHELRLIHNDTGCDPGVAMDALYDFIYRREKILMVIGGACSDVTKTLAEIVPYWNLILVSFASTSPALSEREKYTTFFRLAPADSSQNIPRARFITHFTWNTVATLYEMGEDHSLAIDDLGKAFEQNNITIKISQSFRRYDDIEDNLLEIKDHDARIIIGSFSEKAARQVLCMAYKLKLYGGRYVWIFLGDYVERWWELREDTTCTPEQLSEAAEGYFTIDSLNSLSDDDLSSANISLRQFLDDYAAYKGPRPMSPYATSTYDTVWTIALTLKQTQHKKYKSDRDTDSCKLGSFSYDGGDKIKSLIFDRMQNLGFYGISGPISFEGPDRKGISVISQNQDGRMSRIALYEPDEDKLNFFCRTCQSINWMGGRAPRDKKVLVPRQKKILPLAFVCVSSVSVAGLILAGTFLAYNLYHRRLRYIKLSSPKLNNVAVVGCMFVYSGIIVLGYDNSSFEENTYPYICTARVFLFAAGFSLAFGAMFTKTYRVHQIFTRANSGLIKSKLLRDKQLLFIVGFLLFVDSAVLMLWALIDPMRKHVTNLTEEASESDEDLFFISQLTTCHSEHLDKWTGAMYAYKGLLLVFGVYMAWETRSVKIPALNDSQYIGMNVYNVVIMSVIVVTLSNILSHQPTLAYVMESSFMLFSTTTTLCLLFVPKIYAIITSSGDPIIAASGITVDGANCRRFAVDEKRDLLYRAEVQNRVYKREIVELDQEIMRLEGLLELPVKPYPRVTKELLYMLPESAVDPTPTMKRREPHLEMYHSISDAAEVCMGTSEDKSDGELDTLANHTNPTVTIHPCSPKLLHCRSNRLGVRFTSTFSVSKLCKLRTRSRFSVGSLSINQDCQQLKLSPSTPDLPPMVDAHLEDRVTYPLLRQRAFEDTRAPSLSMNDISEKSDSITHDSHVSENESDKTSTTTTPVTFHLSDDKDYLQLPSKCANTSMPGCEYTKVASTNISLGVNKRSRTCSRLSVPPSVECKISAVDVTNTTPKPRMKSAQSIIEHERRTRIRKLQNDLMKIQQELQDLDSLGYEVSIV